MPGYSDLISSFGAPSAPAIPQFGNNFMDMGQPINIGDFGQVGGAGGSLSDALAAYTANAGKFTTKDMLSTGLTGVQTIGGLIGALGSYGLAKKQFALTKRTAEANLGNSVMAYNTSLEDKARSRAVVEGQSDAERDSYVASHRATTG